MSAIPKAEVAVIDRRKIANYVLDPDHRLGRHKARVFAAALGLTKERAGLLVEALRGAIRDEDAVLRRQDAHGAHYAVEFIMTVGDRRATVRSLWTIRTHENFPRFVTAFVAGKDDVDG
ncbi:MAG TPA: hypothetical protein VG735_01635 [Caulobacterales bacterium]|jgi:hypothetical protein|nr:hypothetical protein [Caulobacterales bacterium]